MRTGFMFRIFYPWENDLIQFKWLLYLCQRCSKSKISHLDFHFDRNFSPPHTSIYTYTQSSSHLIQSNSLIRLQFKINQIRSETVIVFKIQILNWNCIAIVVPNGSASSSSCYDKYVHLVYQHFKIAYSAEITIRCSLDAVGRLVGSRMKAKMS